MNFEDFVNQTNIKDIVKREFRKENNDADERCLPNDHMNSRLEFYYHFRTETDRWHLNGIKNLKYNQSQRQNSNEVSKIDFNHVNHEEIEGFIPETENMARVRDIGVQCSLKDINTNDKSTSTDNVNLQPGEETNANFSGNTTECTIFSSSHKWLECRVK